MKKVYIKPTLDIVNFDIDESLLTPNVSGGEGGAGDEDWE